MSDPAEAKARALAKRILALGGSDEVRRKAALRLVLTDPISEAPFIVSAMLSLARSGDAAVASALVPLVRALNHEEAGPDALELLRRVAALGEQTEVELLLSEGSPAREYDLRAAARADARQFVQPLGYLKTQARLSKDPDEMARLAVASNPAVVRELLKNPRLTEPMVVRIAARRPARPEPLEEIWRNPRWSARGMVRRALAMNPYLPVEVGVKILPLLSKADWQAVVGDASLHETLRLQAAAFLRVGET